MMSAEQPINSSTLSYDAIVNRNVGSTGNSTNGSAGEYGAMGKFKMAASGFGWKSGTSGSIVTVPLETIRRFEWLRAHHGHQLRIVTKDDRLLRFDGFPGEAQGELSRFLTQVYHHTLEPVEISVKGWNWGRLEAPEGKQLEFRVDDRLSFDFSVDAVANAAVTGRDELTLELNADAPTGDSLSQIRFYLPTPPKPEKTEKEEEAELDRLTKDPAAGLQAEQDAEESEDEATRLCELIRAGSLAAAAPGTTVVAIADLPCLVPRGRLDAEFGREFVRLRGKTYDYKILFSSIQKLFLLPKADEVHVLLVAALDPPLRQGQTRYPFLVFQFPKEEFIELQVEEAGVECGLERKYDGPLFEVVSTVFRQLTAQKLVVPGSFRSTLHSLPCIKGAWKANEGHLYLLERSCLFLPKPVFLMAHAEISKVMFGRTGPGLGNPRSFDLKIVLKGANPVVGSEVTLSNVPKEELEVVEEYFTSKNISVIREGASAASASSKKYELSSEEDEDYDEEDDEDSDGDRKRKKARAEARPGSEDEDSPDEDYVEGDDSEDEEFGSDDSNDESEGSNDESGSGSAEEDYNSEEEDEE